MSKVFIEETTLSAIGNAIREKTGKTDLIAPGTMPNEIRAIETGGGGSIEVEPIVLTGDQEKGCANDMCETYIKLFGNTITTKDITRAVKMFDGRTTLETIPFDINMSSSASSTDINTIFNNCNKLKTLPYIYNAKPTAWNYMFAGCQNLREIPEDYLDTWNFTNIDNATSNYAGHSGFIFNGCYSLRKFPMEILKHTNPKIATYTYSIYYCTFSYCKSLDEIIGMPLHKYVNTTNAFYGIVGGCARLKNFTFETNEDGSPIVFEWKGQTVELNDLGYASSVSAFDNLPYSGITREKYVSDDATYQALKNDPDWWTDKKEYSRYNHDSAVATINSLPDTSAYLASSGGATNIIKFKGELGSLTDGGAINTLTEEEIAVATAKGWTVSLY